MLKKAAGPFFALLLIAAVAGCASSQSPSASIAPADVSGTWTGGTATGAATYVLVLKQTGSAVTGNLTGAGTADGPIEGTVDGNTIRLRERSGYGSTPTLSVKGDQISGTIGNTTLNLRRTAR